MAAATASTYDIVLHQKQGEALRYLRPSSPINVLGYGGARGGGKSFLARAWTVLRCLKYPQSRALIVRRSFPELEGNHAIPLQREHPYLDYLVGKNRFNFPNGSILDLRHCDGPRDVFKFQGQEFDTIVIDEAQTQEKSVYYALRACLRNVNPDLNPKMLLTFNPGGIGHSWLKKLFIDCQYDENENPEEHAFLAARVYDNPSIMENDPAYVNRLESLPHKLREAYLNGNFEIFEGQFFNLSPEMAEDPFEIQDSALYDRLFGSLDHGITHDTVYNQYYLDDKGYIHLLFTYVNNGGTARSHAREIRSRIEAFKWTRGMMPKVVFADPSMWTKSRTNEDMIRAIIDEYEDEFRGTRVRYQRANNDKLSGCELMRTHFSGEEGIPKMLYWRQYNKGLVEALSSMVGDPNQPEIYQKVDGDDIVDSVRYGIAGIHGAHATEYVMQRNREYAARRQEKMRKTDWLNV